MNHDHMIAIIEAHKKDWRSVEFRRKDSNNAWVTPAMNTHFNFFDFEYRIIPPKPKMVKYFGWRSNAGCLLSYPQNKIMGQEWHRYPILDCELPE